MSKSANQSDVYWKIRNQDVSNQKHHTRRVHWLDQQLPLEEPCAQILDAGCGEAFFSPLLARRADHTRACDYSPTQIATNCEVHPNINFFVQDLANPITAEPKSFDAVWASDTLSQIINPGFALNEFHRVLKPDGKLLITVPYHGFMKNLMIALFKWEKHFAVNNPQIRFFTVKMLTRLVKRVGFRNIELETGNGEILLSAKK
jgi:SAM-dependent methyltransferase